VPVAGKWTDWTDWTECTATCGGGNQERSRACTNPPPSGGGKDCRGAGSQSRQCNKKACPLDGAWSEWTLWTDCSKTCGTGKQVRTRKCDNPRPTNGGEKCEGEKKEAKDCQIVSDCRPPVELPRIDACGIGKPQRRITGGKPAALGSWPWIAAIGYEMDGKIDYLCGGTLITTRHVITAGHCIRDDLKTVLLGELIIGNTTDGANPQEIGVSKVTRHSKYSGSSFNNDIAILELEKDVKFSEDVQPACITDNPTIVQKFDNTGLSIAGWGAINFRGPTSKILLEGKIRPVSTEDCQEKFKPFRNVEINEKKICARDLGNKIDACQGDSGGPMTAYEWIMGERPFRYYLVGVVSFGYRCNVPGFPGVYTRVTEYIPWIKQNIK